jgi:hypothetical protein
VTLSSKLLYVRGAERDASLYKSNEIHNALSRRDHNCIFSKRPNVLLCDYLVHRNLSCEIKTLRRCRIRLICGNSLSLMAFQIDEPYGTGQCLLVFS